jgi:UPF0271 protein
MSEITSKITIDINSDIGELPEAIANGTEEKIMRQLTSANIACGGHAGDEQTMEITVGLAKKLGVGVGAHPGYPDRENFGRTEMEMSPEALEASVREQIAALQKVAKRHGVPVVHVKPHGALYHAANNSKAAAEAISRAALACDPKLIMVGQSGSNALRWYAGMGLETVAEAFADRAYEADGTLRNRKLPGALMQPAGRAAEQGVGIATRGEIITIDGQRLAVAAQTICIHSDTPGAPDIARALREHLQAAGVKVAPLRAGAGK